MNRRSFITVAIAGLLATVAPQETQPDGVYGVVATDRYGRPIREFIRVPRSRHWEAIRQFYNDDIPFPAPYIELKPRSS